MPRIVGIEDGVTHAAMITHRYPTTGATACGIRFLDPEDEDVILFQSGSPNGDPRWMRMTAFPADVDCMACIAAARWE